MAFLTCFFAHICGQVHCWQLGVQVLPMCQRCTGLYVGGAYALLTWWWFRPRPTSLMVWAHGIMLLVMAPFGFHLVAHGADVRTLTGQLFGFGLVYYLALHPADRLGLWFGGEHGRQWRYALTLASGIPVLLLAVHRGGIVTAWMLTLLALIGVLTFTLLALANLVLFSDSLWRWMQPGTRAT
jgi:uncharacterized membrane protein